MVEIGEPVEGPSVILETDGEDVEEKIIASGDSVTLTWASQNADECLASSYPTQYSWNDTFEANNETGVEVVMTVVATSLPI